MLPAKSKNNLFEQACRYFFYFLILFYMLPVYAADGDAASDLRDMTTGASSITAQTVLANIAAQIPNLTRMTTAIAYVMGFYFVMMGIFKLKEYGEARTMMSSQKSLQGPIVYLVVGAFLIYIPTAIQVGMSTFWTNPTPYGYETGDQNQWTQFLSVCFAIIQFVGLVAFIRGLVILSKLSQGGHQGELSKGMTHIIGGIFCINIYQTVNVILVTLGLNPY